MSVEFQRRRLTIVVLLMAFAFLGHFNRVSISVAGTERLIAQYRLSETQMGSVYSAYLLVYTLCMIPGGWLIDRLGAKAALGALAAGSAVLVALTGGLGFLPLGALVLPALWLVRGSLGLVSVPLHPGCARSVASWMPPASRATANGLVTAAALVGIASTYYLFGTMMDLLDWPLAFVLCGALTAALGAVWWWYATDGALEPNEAAATEPAASTAAFKIASDVEPLPAWHSLLGNRSLLLLTASYAALGYFQYLFFYWMQYYFKDVLHYEAHESRLYATIPNLAMAVAMFAGGGLSDRLVPRFGVRFARATVTGFGLLASAILLLLGIVAEGPFWIVTFFALAMFAAGLGEGCFWTTAIELGGRRGGTSAAIFNTGGNLGGLLAPVVTPLFSAYFGWQWGLALASLVCLVGAVLWLWIDPEEQVASA